MKSNDIIERSGNIVLSPSEEHHQFIYGSQLYGTIFGVFCKFTVKFPDTNQKDECIISKIDVNILNYKGILDLGIYEKPTLEVKDYDFGDETKKSLVMHITLQAIVAGRSKYEQSSVLEQELKVNKDHLFIVERDLIKLNKFNDNPNDPIVKGVFEEEFYFRDGIRFIKREVTDVPDDLYYLNINPTYPQHNNTPKKPSGKCANAVNRLIIY